MACHQLPSGLTLTVKRSLLKTRLLFVVNRKAKGEVFGRCEINREIAWIS